MSIYIYIYTIVVQFVDNILGYIGCKFILIGIYISLTSELVYVILKHASVDKWNMPVEYKDQRSR